MLAVRSCLQVVACVLAIVLGGVGMAAPLLRLVGRQGIGLTTTRTRAVLALCTTTTTITFSSSSSAAAGRLLWPDRGSCCGGVETAACLVEHSCCSSVHFSTAAAAEAKAIPVAAIEHQPQDRNYASGAAAAHAELKAGALKPDGTLVLYRGRWIRLLRVLVRLKIGQLSGVAALALPIALYVQQGNLPLSTWLGVGAVVSGAGAASFALWFYSRRYVGELALLPPDYRKAKFSTLDFWGRREDLIVDTSAIVPPFKGLTQQDLQHAAQQVFIPASVLNQRQFLMSLRLGHLHDKDALFKLLNGTYTPDEVCSRVHAFQQQHPAVEHQASHSEER
eukprot:jgi/Chlat1/7404/Chrsp6S07429